MKGRTLAGKTIRRVHQKLWDPGDNRASAWVIEAIEFTDGSFLRLLTVEGDADYGVEGIYPARPIEIGGPR